MHLQRFGLVLLGELAMEYERLGLALGGFSIGLGLVELAAPGRLARWLGVDGKSAKTVIGLFGARELLAGAMLVRGPAVSTNAWNRVAGDAIDLGALALAFSRSRKREAVAGAAGFVIAATMIDARETARTFPPAERLAAA